MCQSQLFAVWQRRFDLVDAISCCTSWRTAVEVIMKLPGYGGTGWADLLGFSVYLLLIEVRASRDVECSSTNLDAQYKV